MKKTNNMKIVLSLFVFILSILMLAGATKETYEESNLIVEPIQYSVEKPDSVRAIYLTASTVASNRFEEIIDTLIENGGNAVVIDIEHGGGQLAFEPKNEFLKTINPGSTTNNYEEVVNYLHKKGVYAIARQVVFNDPYMGVRRSDWRIEYKWGGGLYDYRWLDPSKPGVQYYNLMIMEELAQHGFDEIQFDYIRFPATNHYYLDYAYDEENFDNSDVINYFLERARKIADEYDVLLGVDTFGAVVWGDVDWKVVGQSIPEMAEIVDVIYPMTYPSHYSPGFYGYYNMYYEPYDIVHDSIERFVEQAAGNAEIRPYIQGFTLRAYNFGEEYVADQIQAGYDAGATGFAIWNAGNSYTYSWSSVDITPPPIESENIDIE
ncbi:putative glycoside hydrolase [Patescibacteria group bacterium]|nr:putative glycoside hydrolase [Patescibacteria group bacterium]MBU1682595.1 putative glycoside hydrolase [Patescibacteria group bacterium]